MAGALLSAGLFTLLQVWTPVALLCVVTWTVGKAVYNVYFHPLSQFPGPKLAAASLWWQTHLDVVEKGSLAHKLVELHGLYGDIVRIGPNELHFAKPSVYHEIYNPQNRWEKDPYLYQSLVLTEVTTTIPNYTRAKRRRDITTTLFSRRSIINLQSFVQESIDAMCANIDMHISANKPVEFRRAFRCCVIDAICSFCFGRSPNATSEPEFRSSVEHSMHAAIAARGVFKHFPFLKYVVFYLPPQVTLYLQPQFDGQIMMSKMFMKQIKEILTNPQSLAEAPHPTIYTEYIKLLDVPNTGVLLSELSLYDEAWQFVFAGTDTTSDTLAQGTLNVLYYPEMYARVRKELDMVWPKLDVPARYEDIENLPYLRAVVKESLRMSHGVVSSLTRVVPPEGAVIDGAFIPGGTTVGQSPIFVHLNEDIFPDPHVFKPERWLGTEGASLDNWLVPFSKGPRSCLGIHLAYCEIYLAFANLFRRYDLKLDDANKPSDWRWKDIFVPHYVGPELHLWARPRTT